MKIVIIFEQNTNPLFVDIDEKFQALFNADYRKYFVVEAIALYNEMGKILDEQSHKYRTGHLIREIMYGDVSLLTIRDDIMKIRDKYFHN